MSWIKKPRVAIVLWAAYHFLLEKQKIPDRKFCQGRIKQLSALPPCFTVSRAPLQDTSISQTSNGSHSVAEYSAFAFDCALRGPFNDLFFIRLSAFPDSLWKHHRFYLRINGFLLNYKWLYHSFHVLSSKLHQKRNSQILHTQTKKEHIPFFWRNMPTCVLINAYCLPFWALWLWAK